ncbi:hypothetical protein K439DRAFT_564641 [Ramaria rubella]|nr:hypothetical protein K439DRAFT_564641 [Ramaria rubella]
MSSPPPKRQRTLSGKQEVLRNIGMTSIEHVDRSKDIYFEDGNIVLIAQNTAFRVHRGHLARHSEVFRGLLEAALHSPSTELFDSCHIVRLSDKSEDFVELLRVFYDLTQLSKCGMKLLFVLVRLSSKYFIHSIRTATLEVLDNSYPSTLEKWNPNGVELAECLEVIEIAHELHADCLLPSAYYNLCSFPANDVTQSRHASFSLLAKYSCGKESLGRYYPAFIENFLVHRKPCPACIRPDTTSCFEAFEELNDKALSFLTQPITSFLPDPLCVLMVLSRVGTVDKLCPPCKKNLSHDIKTQSQQIWDALPGIFGLGSWATLTTNL